MKVKNIFLSKWEQELKQLNRYSLNRTLKIHSGLDFSSNDYLSLGHHSGIRKALIQALKKNLPLSSHASRLVRGHTLWHEKTEFLFQKWIGSNVGESLSALFFSSGYLANLGLISTLCRENFVLFSDQLNHASLIDGCRFSPGACHIYAHKDMNQLESFLKKQKKQKKIIITESLFSMDGDFAPLKRFI